MWLKGVKRERIEYEFPRGRKVGELLNGKEERRGRTMGGGYLGGRETREDGQNKKGMVNRFQRWKRKGEKVDKGDIIGGVEPWGGADSVVDKRRKREDSG